MLFQGSLAKALAGGPPTWFMEGMASYVGRDENVRDTMFLRDAVVNDIIPPITHVNIEGFFAYRFGHAVFSFIEDRWGHEGFLDFIFEMRNTIGGRVDRAIKRAFKLERGGVRHRVPPLAAQEVPAVADRDRRAGGLRADLPRQGRARHLRDLAGRLALRRPGRSLQRLPRQGGRGAVRRAQAHLHPQSHQALLEQVPVPGRAGAVAAAAASAATSPSRPTATPSRCSPSARRGAA